MLSIRSYLQLLFLVIPISAAAQDPAYNVTGRYVSDIGGPIQRLKVSSRQAEVNLFQSGNIITGTYGTKSKGGKIYGTMEGNIIKFSWGKYPKGGPLGGSWKVKPETGELIGSWQSGHTGSGRWNLRLVDKNLSIPRMTATPVPKFNDDDELVRVASGSGFSVSAQGHLVTNEHVINGCSRIETYYRGKPFQATLLYRDQVNDLAVLQVDFEPAQVFKISRRNPQLLQDVFVAGYPFGEKISTSVKITKGIVSSLTGIGNNVSNIQIDAALQPGNSGGPILDQFGNVVGVAVAKLDLERIVKNWGVVPENTNFGIKSNVVVNLLESNGIEIEEASDTPISNSVLGKTITDATLHLSCYMTKSEVKEALNSKVRNRDLTN